MKVPFAFMTTWAPAGTLDVPVTDSGLGCESGSLSLSRTLPENCTDGKPLGVTPTSTSVLPTAVL